MRSVAVVLLLSTVSAQLAAAACLLDCERPPALAATHQTSCHDGDSIDDAAVRLASVPAVCHEDHSVLTAEVSTVFEVRVSHSVVALSADIRSSSLPVSVTSGTAVLTSPPNGSPAPTGAVLPLRL